jgi:hypothetical protein
VTGLSDYLAEAVLNFMTGTSPMPEISDRISLGSRRQLYGCPADAGVTIMEEKTPIIVGRAVRNMLSQLHMLYGNDQTLHGILGGLHTRLTTARRIYGPTRSIPQVVSGIYEQLDELQKLYGGEPIEEVLAGIIERKKRLNRMVELQSKVALNVHELREF